MLKEKKNKEMITYRIAVEKQASFLIQAKDKEEATRLANTLCNYKIPLGKTETKWQVFGTYDISSYKNKIKGGSKNEG